MNNPLIVNLLDEAMYIYELIYSDPSLTLVSDLYCTSAHGHHIRSLTARDILLYLYYGIEDRTGKFLVWRKEDTNDRAKFLSTRTLYAKSELPGKYDTLSLDYIDTVLMKTIMPYVTEYGSEYSMLLFSHSTDSLVIGMGTDIRIIEWEEGCRSGKIAPDWVHRKDLWKHVAHMPPTFSSELVDKDLDVNSNDPNVVNSAILEMDKLDMLTRPIKIKGTKID